MRINVKLSSRFLTRPSYLQLTLLAGVVLGTTLSPLAVSRAEAQSSSTYYVSPNGSDANTGSQAYPWATITHASSVVSPGNTVVVEDGTYNIAPGGSVNGTLAGDWAIGSSGTSGSPITYVAQHKWQAKLVGHGIGDGSAVIGMQGGYNILKDFDITGTDAAGVNLATTGTTASFNQAIGNYVHDIVVPCDSNGGEALDSGAGGDYTGISHNDFIGNLVVNVTNAGGSGCSVNTTVGIYEAVPYGTVANNIVINAGYAIQSWHAASHLTIFGNTELNSRTGVLVGAGDAPGGTNDYTLVQNNIAVNNSNAGIIEEGNTGTHNQYIDNLTYGNNVNISLQNGLSASGTVTANPLFVNNTGTATGDYHVQSSSPARGTGLALAGILTDNNGSSRPQSGATDIGACLFTTASIPSAPGTLRGRVL
jgi:hypothetical protein